MYVYLNGQFYEKDRAMISITNQSYLYGYGLFETIKVTKQKMIYFDEHYERLEDSCRVLDMELHYSKQDLAEKANKLITSNGLHEGAIKIVYSKDESRYDLLITTREYSYPRDLYIKGARALISEIRRNEHSPFVRLKSTNYLDNIIVRDNAIKNGFNEAIFLNTSDNLAEGTISNIFWIKNRSLYTPDIHCGLLPGIMRQKFIDTALSNGIETHTGAFDTAALWNADHVYLTNSLMGVMPVSEIVFDKNSIQKYSIGDFYSV